MKYPIISMLALSLLLAGCTASTSQNSEQYDKIAEQLAQINQKLDSISQVIEGRNRQPLVIRNAVSRKFSRNQGEAIALAQIPKLSEKPSAEEVKKYIEAIRKASAGQMTFTSEDIQIKMLQEIGPGYLQTVVVPFLDLEKTEQQFFHLNYALPYLVAKDDKDFVLKNILNYPRFAAIALENGWGKEARRDIFNVFENNDFQRHLLCSKIGEIVETPEDRAKLIELYTKGTNTMTLYDTIKTFPDIDMEKIDNEAWENQRFSNSWNHKQYAIRAASRGNLSALEFLIMETRMDDMKSLDRDYTAALRRLTGLPPNADSLMAWFRKNKDRLYFDKEQQRFLVKEETATAPAGNEP